MSTIKTATDITKMIKVPNTECFVPTPGGERVIWLPPKTKAFKLPGIGRMAKPMRRNVIVYETDLDMGNPRFDRSYPEEKIGQAVADFLADVNLEDVQIRTYTIDPT